MKVFRLISRSAPYLPLFLIFATGLVILLSVVPSLQWTRYARWEGIASVVGAYMVIFSGIIAVATANDAFIQHYISVRPKTRLLFSRLNVLAFSAIQVVIGAQIALSGLRNSDGTGTFFPMVVVLAGVGFLAHAVARFPQRWQQVNNKFLAETQIFVPAGLLPPPSAFISSEPVFVEPYLSVEIDYHMSPSEIEDLLGSIHQIRGVEEVVGPMEARGGI